MRQMPRTIFGCLKIFGVHQNDEFSVRFYGANMAAHTRAFGSMTLITFCSITVNCLHNADYTNL